MVLSKRTVPKYNPMQNAPVPKLSQFQKFVSRNNLRTIVLMITVNAIELVHQCC